MTRFHTDCIIKVIDGAIKSKPFELEVALVYETGLLAYDSELIIVPAGYRTDFASIPRFFHRVLPPVGKYSRAAVVHDWLCDVRPPLCKSDTAADIFREAMVDLGVSPWKIGIMVFAVKTFGPKF